MPIESDLPKNAPLIPLTKWPEHHPWPTIGGLRHLVFNAEKNGFDEVICRVGGRVLIDEGRFFQWAKGNGGDVK
ncbi:MAG: hypothetical protein HQL52_19895 [Magnetococcales bacterium]|nr:hypothetical protein [Magnetococcales bacterium]